MKVTQFINGEVQYDEFSGKYFWIKQNDGGSQMLAEMRGFGAIQHLFKDTHGIIDVDKAAEFQDEIGKWIAAAINEKREIELKNETAQV